MQGGVRAVIFAGMGNYRNRPNGANGRPLNALGVMDLGVRP